MSYRNGTALHHVSRPTPAPTLPAAADAAAEARKKPSRKPESRKRLTNGELARVTMLLMQHGAVDASGVYTYHDGWSDEAIRQTLPGNANVRTIRDMRRDAFGRTRDEIGGRGGRNPAFDAARIAALESEIDGLKRRLEALEGAIVGPGQKAA